MKLMNMYQIKKIYKLLSDFQESFWQSMQYYMQAAFCSPNLIVYLFYIKTERVRCTCSFKVC